jgi:hypothetical protein
MAKKTKFRQGQKLEIGYDLNKNYTGYHNSITLRGNGTAFSTAEGEFLSNYFENSETKPMNKKTN